MLFFRKGWLDRKLVQIEVNTDVGWLDYFVAEYRNQLQNSPYQLRQTAVLCLNV